MSFTADELQYITDSEKSSSEEEYVEPKKITQEAKDYLDFVRKYANDNNISFNEAYINAKQPYREQIRRRGTITKNNLEDRYSRPSYINRYTDLDPHEGVDEEINKLVNEYVPNSDTSNSDTSSKEDLSSEGSSYLSDIEEDKEEEEEFFYPDVDEDLHYSSGLFGRVQKELRTKPKKSYPDYINSERLLITFIPDKSGQTGEYQLAEPYGSANYMFQKYPGDIDLNEKDYENLSRDQMIKKFATHVKSVIKNIKDKRLHYFVEFKAGEDVRYKIDIGDLSDGYWVLPIDLKQEIGNYYEKRLISGEEYDIIGNILNSKKYNSTNYDIVKQIFREHMVLRWNEQEILNGYKMLPLKKKMTLIEALGMKGHIKIDEISYVNNKFIEITNFVFLGTIDENGIINQEINLDSEDYLEDIPENLKRSIEETFYSTFKFSPFKTAKRIFALSRIQYLRGKINYLNYLDSIVPLLSSNVGILYQAKSELEAIIRIFDTRKSFPVKAVNHQLQEIKYSLSNVLELDDKTLNIFNDQIDFLTKATTKNIKKAGFEKLINEFTRLINYETINYFNENGINPLPRDLLPQKMKYKYKKIDIIDFINGGYSEYY